MTVNNRKCLSVSAIAAILGLILGGVLGATLASKKAAEDAYTSALFWHLVIDRDHQSGNIERADELNLTATDATLSVLDQLQKESPISSGWALLTGEGTISHPEKFFAFAREILQSRIEELSDESRDFLARASDLD